MKYVTKSILKQIYKPRQEGVRKYNFGLLLVIGGSEFYSGSPALVSLAAFRTGVDMVGIMAPERAANIISSFSPNLAAFPLKGKYLKKKHLPILLSMTKSAEIVSQKRTSIVIGGGMGRGKETQKAIVKYLSKISFPVVIDADAIYAVAGREDLIKGKPFLFTPHSYEFFVLTGKEIIGKREEEKIKLVEQEARRLQTTILLKGSTDIISNGKETILNKTGSPYMTTGGCGDTLAGICGALLARRISLFTAAQAGAFINGKAGEFASEKKKDGLMATDLIEEIPKVFLEL